MKKTLRVPAALAVVVLGGAAAGGLVSSISCHDAPAPADASGCEMYCVPTTYDAGTVCLPCADAGHCSTGCEAVIIG
jgi:hypothetical protein